MLKTYSQDALKDEYGNYARVSQENYRRVRTTRYGQQPIGIQALDYVAKCD